MKSWNGANKQIARQKTGQSHRRYSSVLELPGKTCMSTSFFINQGMIGSFTDLVAVEYEKRLLAGIETTLKTLPLKSYELFHGDIHSYNSGRKFDLINLDLCALVLPPTLQWLSQGLLKEGGDLSVNMQVVHRRTKEFEVILDESFRRNYSVLIDVYEKYPKMVGMDRGTQLAIASILTSLNQWDFDLTEPFIYRDVDSGKKAANDMRLCNFLNMRKADNPLPSLDTFLVGGVNYKPTTPKHGNGNRSVSSVDDWVELRVRPSGVRLLSTHGEDYEPIKHPQGQSNTLPS